MKNYLIIPLLTLSVGFCQQKKNDKPNPMKGVKTQTVIVYVYETLIRKNISKYDSNGNKVEDSSYDSEGSLNWKHISKYDSNGNMVEELSYYSDGKRNKKSIFKYDSNGNMVEGSGYDSEGSSSGKSVKKFDSNGNMVEIGRAHV